MLVTLWWWLILDVGGRIIMLATFFVIFVIFSMYLIGHQNPESVTNVTNLSPTHWSLSVTNIYLPWSSDVYGPYKDMG